MKHTRYFSTYLDAYNYYPNGVPSTEIALVGDASYIFVSSDNAYSGNVTFFNAGMTNDQIVDTMTEAAYTTGYTSGYDGGYSYGYSYGFEEGYDGGYDDGYDEGYDDGEEAAAMPNDYFAIEMTSLVDEATVTLENGGAYTRYSFDKHTWTNVTSDATITLTSNNNKVYIVRRTAAWQSYITFSSNNSSDVFKLTGNLGSLTEGFDYYNINSFGFSNMFQNITAKIDASELIIPNNSSCNYLFSGCTGLIAAPSLSNVTTLPTYAFEGMFAECTSLTTAPALPATIMTDYCYTGMFSGCTSLTTAPALPATTLASGCYNSMFSGCTSLVNAPMLAATSLPEQCYYRMFAECTSLTSLVMLGLIDSDSKWSLDGIVQDGSSTGTLYKDSSVDSSLFSDILPEGWTVQDYVAPAA